MINSIDCAAPAGFDGSGRVRASALLWSAPLGADRNAMGGALPTGTSLRGTEQPAVPTAHPATGAQVIGTRLFGTEPLGTEPSGTTPVLTTPVVTTDAYTTLGNHSPRRPQS